MIRINLLPVAEARAEARGRNELIIFAAGVAALAALFALAWFIQTAAIDELKQKVSLSQSRNDEIKKEVENAGEVKSRTNKLTQQLAVLADLKSKRTGPVRVLDELQAIMSLPRNEEDRFAQRERGWDVDWDPRRLWLASLSEVEVRAESPDALPGFELVGTAMSAEDVAQFMRPALRLRSLPRRRARLRQGGRRGHRSRRGRARRRVPPDRRARLRRARAVRSGLELRETSDARSAHHPGARDAREGPDDE